MKTIPLSFSALGDPVRFAIVDRLLTQGESPVSALLDVADISGPAISRHLKLLRNAGIITQKIDAQRRLYSVRPEALARIHVWTMDHRAFWEASLDRLEELIEKEDSNG